MITAYLAQNNLAPQIVNTENTALLQEAVWIDLLAPTNIEEALVEQCLDLGMPTREEMQEIELSSRLYRDKDTLFMTAIMIAHSDSPEPKLDPVTFVLTEKKLITIRNIEPQSFQLFGTRLQKLEVTHRTSNDLLIELLDATIDRLADILELVGSRLDDYSKTIFRPQTDDSAVKLDYRKLMQKLGTSGDLNTKARESLITFNRLITFYAQTNASRINHEGQLRLVTATKDIASLSDHANFLSTKVNFLLDATLGMINIEQNNAIKIFSVAAVIFLPPTLIASIYGMNFQFMPALAWKSGYLITLGSMLLSSWLPYKYFKYRKWL
ncbi:MAG: magnesium transporter CorA family protein [Proteobacteria bacterium]|nr:magnesium transporter CorA family protein [Pseudomonadota bacterium]